MINFIIKMIFFIYTVFKIGYRYTKFNNSSHLAEFS